MPCPSDHDKFYSLADAERALRSTVAFAKRTGKGGKSWKRLNVFQCGNHFHVGRANSLPKHKATAPPKVKLHSWSFIRKRIEKIGLQIDRDRQKRVSAINAMMEAEKQIDENLAAMRELETQIVGEYFRRAFTRTSD